MPTPFPGMDPYLEHPELWPDVHLGMIAATRTELAPRLSPRYAVSVEERTYIAAHISDSFTGRGDVLVASDRGPAPVRSGSNGGVTVREPVAVYVPAPDVVTERYLEVRNVQYGYVVTVIELLSPSHKRPGSEGYREYQTKREQLLSTRTSLVEIDLLRAGQRPPIHGEVPDSDYRIVVVRGCERPKALLYPFDVQDPIPAIPLPLERGDEEPLLDLNMLLHRLYDQAVYNLRIDYRQPATPPLDEADAVWAAELVESRQVDNGNEGKKGKQGFPCSLVSFLSLRKRKDPLCSTKATSAKNFPLSATRWTPARSASWHWPWAMTIRSSTTRLRPRPPAILT